MRAEQLGDDPAQRGGDVLTRQTEGEIGFEEAEAIMLEVWKGEKFAHHGRYFDLRLPALRPAPFTKPHPYVIRAAATEHGMLEVARQGRPFMMNVQTNAETARRLGLYRSALRDTGLDDAAVEARVGECWVWRNVCVAETDAEAERIGVPAFHAMQEMRAAMRHQVYAEQGVSIVPMPAPGTAPPARAVVEHSLVRGSPATVAEKLAALRETGVGGLIMQFRLGPMSYEDTARSLTLFREQVAPALGP